MKKTQLVLAILFIFCSLNIKAQTAEEIAFKNIENSGGKEKLNKITSMNIDFTMNIMGTEAPSSGVLLVGKGLRSETNFGGQKLINVITDKGGWTINPMAGLADPQPMEQQQYLESKDQLDVNPFLDYQTKGSKLELIGKEKLNNEDVYKINFTSKDNITTTCYFNATNYYLVKTVKKVHLTGQETDVVTTYSDFRKTDYGVTMAFNSKIDYGQFQMTMAINKIEFNKPVDASVFEMKK